MSYKIIFIGDVSGGAGRKAVQHFLPGLIEKHQPDLVIANGGNATHGHGFNRVHHKELTDAGVHFFTGGNHSFYEHEHVSMLNQKDPDVIRPANYPPGAPGRGWKIVETGMRRIAVINLQGRAFMKEEVDCPLRTLSKIMNEELAHEHLDSIFIDFHAETTSEKKAMFYYCEQFERVSAVVGTHTHVQTNDAQVGPTGIGFLTDAGMCGAYRSIIGVAVEPILKRMLTQLPQKHIYNEDGGLQFNGVLFKMEQHDCTEVTPINLTFEN